MESLYGNNWISEMDKLSPIELGGLIYDNGGRGALAARARKYAKMNPEKLLEAQKAYFGEGGKRYRKSRTSKRRSSKGRSSKRRTSRR